MPHIDRAEAIDRIKRALKARSGKTWSVTGSRGTAWGWLTIHVPPKDRDAEGYMPKDRRDELHQLLGLADFSHVHMQGESISPDSREWYVLRAEGVRGRNVHGGADWDPRTPAEQAIHDAEVLAFTAEQDAEFWTRAPSAPACEDQGEVEDDYAAAICGVGPDPEADTERPPAPELGDPNTYDSRAWHLADLDVVTGQDADLHAEPLDLVAAGW